MENPSHEARYSLVAILIATSSANAQEHPKVGDRFGDWVFQCEARAEGQTDCAFVQTIVNSEDKKPMAQIRILAPRENGTGGIIALLPLGLNLEQGVSGVVDGAGSVDVRVSTCLPRGCLAQIDLTPDVVARLEAGTILELTYDVVSVGRRVTLNSSLSGVSSALSASGWY